MEYSVFSKIQAFNPTYRKPLIFSRTLSPYPATDCVNPGVGGVKLYANYVPLYGPSYNTVQKKVEAPTDLTFDLEGQGEEPESLKSEINANERQSILDSLNESIKAKLPENVYKSILHPGGIKTGKLLVNQKNPSSEPRKRNSDTSPSHDQDIKKPKINSSSIKHKFQFV